MRTTHGNAPTPALTMDSDVLSYMMMLALMMDTNYQRQRRMAMAMTMAADNGPRRMAIAMTMVEMMMGVGDVDIMKATTFPDTRPHCVIRPSLQKRCATFKLYVEALAVGSMYVRKQRHPSAPYV